MPDKTFDLESSAPNLLALLGFAKRFSFRGRWASKENPKLLASDHQGPPCLHEIIGVKRCSNAILSAVH